MQHLLEKYFSPSTNSYQLNDCHCHNFNVYHRCCLQGPIFKLTGIITPLKQSNTLNPYI